MANVVYLPQNPNALLLSEGSSSLAKGITEGIKQRRQLDEERRRVEDLVEYMTNLQTITATSEGQLTRSDLYRIDPPASLSQDMEGLEARMKVLEHFGKSLPVDQPTIETQTWYVPAPGTKGKFRDEWVPAEDINVDIRRPGMEMRTLEEVKALVPDRPKKGEGAGKLTEGDKDVRAILDVAGLPSSGPYPSRARLWKNTEDDLEQVMFSMAGTYNQDTNRWTVNNPQLFRKLLNIKREVKQGVLKEGKDPFGYMTDLLNKQGFAPPKKGLTEGLGKEGEKEEEGKGPIGNIMEGIRNLLGTGDDLGKKTPDKAVSQEVSIGEVGGQDIRLPRSIRSAVEASKYLQEKYKLSQQQADQLLLRYHGSK